MHRLIRVLTVAGAGSLALIGAVGGAAPAHASTESIVRFALPTLLQGDQPSDLVVHFDPVVDLGTGPEHAAGVSGTLSITVGGTSLTRSVSGDGATADVTIDLAQLSAGDVVLSGSIDATGADTPFVFDDDRVLSLVAGPTGTPVAAGYAQAEAHRDLWGCDAVEYEGAQATCVVGTPRSGDETWQRGFRLAFHWTRFVAVHDPDATCEIQPMLPLRADGSAPEPLMSLRVPGDWSSYSIPMASAELTGWVPGSSQMSWYLECNDLFTPWVGVGKQSASDLVPDLPPTEPTTVTASASAGDLAVSTGGSTALGAAPLQGYDVAVLDGTGTQVADQQVAAASAPVAGPTPGAMRAMLTKPASHTFHGLKPGAYVVRVAAYNSVGSSDAVSSSVVHVGAAAAAKPAPKPLSAVRSVKAKRSGTKARVSWAAPARTAGGIARYTIELRRGAHHVKTVRVAGAKHRVVLTGLAKHRAYRVVITATAKDGRTTRVSKTISG